jgi:hypothetical protein
MPRIARIVAAAVAGITAILVLYSKFELGPSRTREVRTLIAENVPRLADGKCPEPVEIVRLGRGGLELNGREMARADVLNALTVALRDRARRVAFVDAAESTPFGEVASVMNALRELEIEPAMLTPGLDRGGCIGLRRSGRPEAYQKMEGAPWWRFW